MPLATFAYNSVCCCSMENRIEENRKEEKRSVLGQYTIAVLYITPFGIDSIIVGTRSN